MFQYDQVKLMPLYARQTDRQTASRPTEKGRFNQVPMIRSMAALGRLGKDLFIFFLALFYLTVMTSIEVQCRVATSNEGRTGVRLKEVYSSISWYWIISHRIQFDRNLNYMFFVHIQGLKERKKEILLHFCYKNV